MRILGASLVILVLPSAIAAQQRFVWPSTGQTHALEEATITGIGLVTAAVIAPIDDRVRTWARKPGQMETGSLARLGAIFQHMGGPVPLAAAAGTWLGASVAGREELAAGGLIAAESIAAAMVAKGLLQRVVGRRRPNDMPHDAWDFGLGRGFASRAYRSFPSGHATNAFALAAAVNEELHHIGSPADPWVSGALYGAASVTSFSRVLTDEHWLSDVIAGAVLGGVTAAIVADANGR